MAFQENGIDITVVAGGDLSAKQFHAVKVNSSGQVVAAGDGEAGIGFVQNKPTSGQAATVRVAGVTKAAAGGTVTAGQKIAANADGKAVTATASENVIGTALTGGTSGTIISVLVEQSGLVPAA